MSTQKAIEDLVNRFVEDIRDIVQRVQRDARDSALRAIGAGPPRPPASRVRVARPMKRVEVPPKRVERAPVKPRPAPVVVRTRKAARLEGAGAPVQPESERRPEQGTSAREAVVLEAVRFLVRATAGEIAARSKLPNGTVYVVLRSLATAGKVARVETAAGVEYSLVSSGGIHPFRRQRASSPPPAAAPDGAAQADSGAATPAASLSLAEAERQAVAAS